MNIIAVIPARMESSRFYGKPLKKICGMPMIGHVFNRVKMCKLLSDVYIATCNDEIKDYADSIGAKAIMTKNTHERATDRVSEAIKKIERKTKKKIDIVVMVQGDEPMIHPNMINDSVAPLIKNKEIEVTNLMSEIKSASEWQDPNEVKVVVDRNNCALYFSREPIPSSKKFDQKIVSYKQVCVISFTKKSLINYCELDETILEKIESVDMNRLLENNIKIKMVLTNRITYAVDTSNDLKVVNELLMNDKLLNSYN